MEVLAQLGHPLLQGRPETHGLHAAARGAGHGADEHEEQQKALGQRRPGHVVRRSESGGRPDGHDLERGGAEVGLQGRVSPCDQVGRHDDDRDDQQERRIEAPLLVSEEGPGATPEHAIVQGEVHARQVHEREGDVLHIRRTESAHRCRVR